MNEFKIKISEDFSLTPKGRNHPDDGNFTGDLFRERLLEPNFEKYDKIVIDLDGIYGCPTSFREEAFGGLARLYSPEEVLSKLEFIAKDRPPLIDLIKTDIKKANEKRK